MSRRSTSSVVAVALAAALAGCSGSSGDGGGHDHGAVPTIEIGAPDVGFSGPQGRTAQFLVECDWSHTATDDPIVFPGQPGASHTHDFFGNVSTDAASDLASLRAADTTCEQRLDRAAYWVPALFDGATQLVPEHLTAYYRPGPGVDPTTIVAYPPGLELLAGDPRAEEPQPIERVSWTCGTGSIRAAEPPACPPDRDLRMLVTFPDCWDGVRLRSEDHRNHAAYSHGGRCGPDHPVAVPQLTVAVAYPPVPVDAQLQLASGGLHSAHADFFNAWDEDKLASEVELCLRRGVVCGVTSSRRSG